MGHQTQDHSIEATRARIEAAFDRAPAPDEDRRTLHQAEAWDSYEVCDRSPDHLGRWQELPATDFAACAWALAHLDAQGIRYYLPALMTLYLERYDRGGRLEDVFGSLEFTLTPTWPPSTGRAPDLRDYQRQRFSLLDAAQRRAIHDFVACVDEHDAIGGRWIQIAEARGAWARAVAAGEDPAWFERFNPLARGAPHEPG